MLPKVGKDVLSAVNYRSISRFNIMSKTYEHILFFKILIHIMPFFRFEQFSLREQHSTISQLINVIDDISSSLNRRFKMAVALLDVEKAFDKIWCDGFIFKLVNLCVLNELINLINSIITLSFSHVRIGNNKSTICHIHAGVPQGFYLSQHLFTLLFIIIIFVNDMLHNLNSKTVIFVDDTLFYATGN